jgi:TraL protein
VTLPQFPGSMKSFRNENKVCEAALDKVNEQIPDNIDPWKNFNS